LNSNDSPFEPRQSACRFGLLHQHVVKQQDEALLHFVNRPSGRLQAGDFAHQVIKQ
jgi:hypothetical protein